jgi:hypothetical protein
MSKRTFLLVLFLLVFGYLINRITFSVLSKDVLLVAQWIWCFIGLIVFENQQHNRLNTQQNRRYVIWFLLIMFISTFSPFYEYNQSIFRTLISQRTNYSIATLLVLLYIHPSVNDIYSTLKKLALLSVGLFFYSVLDPSFFLDVDSLERRLNSGSNDIGISMSLPGFVLITVYFYYAAYKLIISKKKSIQNLIIFLVLMLVIILVQNRQTILITFPIFVFSFIKIRNGYNRFVLILLSGVFLIIVGTYVLSLVQSLIEESSNQLQNSDYNRWQALYVFFLEWKHNVFQVFFGHGVGSLNSKYTEEIASAAETRGAYLQDIGFLGSLFFYGIPFVVLNYYFILQGFLKRNMPYYLKFWCFGLIILPVFQNWGMMNNDSAVVFSLLFYLILYNKKYNIYGLKNANINHYG